MKWHGIRRDVADVAGPEAGASFDAVNVDLMVDGELRRRRGHLKYTPGIFTRVGGPRVAIYIPETDKNGEIWWWGDATPGSFAPPNPTWPSKKIPDKDKQDDEDKRDDEEDVIIEIPITWRRGNEDTKTKYPTVNIATPSSFWRVDTPEDWRPVDLGPYTVSIDVPDRVWNARKSATVTILNSEGDKAHEVRGGLLKFQAEFDGEIELGEGAVDLLPSGDIGFVYTTGIVIDDVADAGKTLRVQTGLFDIETRKLVSNLAADTGTVNVTAWAAGENFSVKVEASTTGVNAQSAMEFADDQVGDNTTTVGTHVTYLAGTPAWGDTFTVEVGDAYAAGDYDADASLYIGWDTAPSARTIDVTVTGPVNTITKTGLTPPTIGANPPIDNGDQYDIDIDPDTKTLSWA